MQLGLERICALVGSESIQKSCFIADLSQMKQLRVSYISACVSNQLQQSSPLVCKGVWGGGVKRLGRSGSGIYIPAFVV